MKIRIYLLLIVSFCVSGLVMGQPTGDGGSGGRGPTPTLGNTGLADQRGYLVGPGDVITVKVLGETQWDFEATVDENGKIEVPFFDESVTAMCKNARELRTDITKFVSKYLRDPQVNVRVKEQKSRPGAVVYGEVRSPTQFELKRNARLLELISSAGGPTDEAGETVQIFRPNPPICATPQELADWKLDNTDSENVPNRIYNIRNAVAGKEDSNPIIYPGDIVYVQRAAPIYFTGEVRSPQGLRLKADGLTLSQAIAMVGGLTVEAQSKDIKIYRVKEGSSEGRELITVNYKLIKEQKQPDIVLRPYDIIDVSKTKKSIAQVILEAATGFGRTGLSTLGNGMIQRVIY